MKKIKFCILLYMDKKSFKAEVEGYQLDDLTGVYWDGETWVITDLKTGASCYFTRTLKQAVTVYENNKSTIDKVRSNKTYIKKVKEFKEMEVKIHEEANRR